MCLDSFGSRSHTRLQSYCEDPTPARTGLSHGGTEWRCDPVVVEVGGTGSAAKAVPQPLRAVAAAVASLEFRV